MIAVELAGGLVALFLGAEAFVRGGIDLAHALRVPAVVVALSVAALGTAMPEVLVSVFAALRGETAMSIGNVTGSNIANVGLVLGTCALVRPLPIATDLARRDLVALLGLQLGALTLALDGRLTRLEGLALLGGGVAHQIVLVRGAHASREAYDEQAGDVYSGSVLRHLLTGLAGLLALAVGSRLFLDGAVDLAAHFAWSHRAVAATLVSLGTIAPELATGLAAVRRGEVEFAVGNVVGSNILNVAFALGSACAIEGLELRDRALVDDLATSAGFAAVLFGIYGLRGRIERVAGMILLVAYALVLWRVVS